ncbi:cytochrome-c peroxidase [Hyalangium rubrum]|uniref:Cytochrome c peroxidase n=1 Tax=Hyalangium rubrum TaxID=3103134 RepID=A0ABU5H230_9BACT|nr:cytochrome c peroxidase [Hyalangium sp. s54d21]MDY7226964.1 cytochrome c peroxidase [Hyalangium sp. s54d21]
MEKQLGRKLDSGRVELGRVLFFDRFLGLHNDNSCSGCHSPTAGFGDTQSIAIGVDNNGVVGPGRGGPRNQRRTPSVINNAFYPRLMLNGRFAAVSGNPFDNSKGFFFPEPEGTVRFPPNDPRFVHLLQAQAHIPFTELPEMAGFSKIRETSFTSSRFQTAAQGQGSVSLFAAEKSAEPRLDAKAPTRLLVFPQRTPRLSLKEAKEKEDAPVVDFTKFDHPPHGAHGVPLPPPLVTQLPDDTVQEFRNEPIRDVVAGRLNANEAYRREFAKVFPEVAKGGPISFDMVGQAIAEFEFSLTFANAPIDRFARGERSAMTAQQKQGALLFFGKANCAACHAARSKSPDGGEFHHEMFSDFEMRVIGVPQIAPRFGVDAAGKPTGNVPFRNDKGQFTEDGTQDFGLEDITADPADRYKFRTSPLRNISLQPAFFHNGAFTRLEDAIRHHLNVKGSIQTYSAASAGVASDLRAIQGPTEPVLQRLDPLLAKPVALTDDEFKALVAFVRDGLLDPRAKPQNLRKQVPKKLPSGQPLQKFEF